MIIVNTLAYPRPPITMSSTTRSLANCTSQWFSTVHTTNGRLISTPLVTPAITPSSTFPPTQHTPPLVILRLRSQTLSFKLPTCIKSTINPLMASMSPQKYVYPDPIPEFAEAETQKFKTELWSKLLKDKETFGDDLDHVVEVCAEIFGEFLHKEYGGPGTLLVEPFTDMLIALKERKLPGAPLAARASLLWAQNYVDQDWEVWNSRPQK